MFDDDYCIAEVAELVESFNQPGIVPLMQANRRLIKNIKRSDEARADLRSQSNPLRLAASQGASLPIEG